MTRMHVSALHAYMFVWIVRVRWIGISIVFFFFPSNLTSGGRILSARIQDVDIRAQQREERSLSP